eukprot:1056913-Pyramimonas_sp.AAC.1
MTTAPQLEKANAVFVLIVIKPIVQAGLVDSRGVPRGPQLLGVGRLTDHPPVRAGYFSSRRFGILILPAARWLAAHA